CKCYCPPNSTIVKVKDCTVCNKNLCIEQRLCVFQNKDIESPDKNNNKSTNSTDESDIHIIESGTDDGYQKSEEENWMTECFKRGSIKDETIIILFLGSTGILLIYAIMKRCFANNYEDGMKYNYTTLNNNSN
ncbi:hypothetical protein PIROE2DRAFT_46877, partial [Piromyces sp. E2]